MPALPDRIYAASSGPHFRAGTGSLTERTAAVRARRGLGRGSILGLDYLDVIVAAPLFQCAASGIQAVMIEHAAEPLGQLASPAALQLVRRGRQIVVTHDGRHRAERRPLQVPVSQRDSRSYLQVGHCSTQLTQLSGVEVDECIALVCGGTEPAASVGGIERLVFRTCGRLRCE